MEPFAVLAQKMLRAALDAVDPFKLIMNRCRVKDDRLYIEDLQLDLKQFKRIYVLGAGKAAAPMARAMEELLGPRLTDGMVIVKYGHGLPTEKIRIAEAGHPIPDRNTLEATQKLLQIAGQCQENDLVFFLLSGGGSALLESLPPQISLEDVQQLNRLLLSCGANIEEINTVRKHISLIKGGRLARQITPARLVSLILSDVIGDPLSGIASGPTAPDQTTFFAAWRIIEKYKLESKLPPGIEDFLRKGLRGEIEETPKANDPVFQKVSNIILGNNLLALKAAQKVAEQEKLNTLILTDRAQGEVGEIAKLLAAIFQSAVFNQNLVQSPGCLLIGGEPTVKLKGRGLGGRNQELVLHILKQIGLESSFFFASVGTDGTDGPTDAAGAWIDHQTMKKVDRLKMDMDEYLDNNDSYHFFETIDQLIKTGPTGTNVMDIMFFLFETKEG